MRVVMSTRHVSTLAGSGARKSNVSKFECVWSLGVWTPCDATRTRDGDARGEMRAHRALEGDALGEKGQRHKNQNHLALDSRESCGPAPPAPASERRMFGLKQ